MASFNAKYLGELMENIDKGEDIETTLEILTKLAIPVRIAEEQRLLEKLTKLASHGTLLPLCEKVAKQVNEMMKKEQEKGKKEEEEKAKKFKKNEKRRENYKRKKEANETNKMEIKKMKMDYEEKAGKTDQPVAASQKPKPAAKKTSLMMKCLKDANKLRKQFK